jgi:hypothetical protein
MQARVLSKTIELIIEEMNDHPLPNNQFGLDGDITEKPSLCRVTKDYSITFHSAHPFVVEFYDPNQPSSPNPPSPFAKACIVATKVNEHYEATEQVTAENEDVYYKYRVTLTHENLQKNFEDAKSPTIFVGDWPDGKPGGKAAEQRKK